jgi:hypothetical protein
MHCIICIAIAAKNTLFSGTQTRPSLGFGNIFEKLLDDQLQPDLG